MNASFAKTSIGTPKQSEVVHPITLQHKLRPSLQPATHWWLDAVGDSGPRIGGSVRGQLRKLAKQHRNIV